MSEWQPLNVFHFYVKKKPLTKVGGFFYKINLFLILLFFTFSPAKMKEKRKKGWTQ